MGARSFIALAVILPCGLWAGATTYDLKTDWSDASNPNGAWSYREGTNALPHVASWQSSFGSSTTAQPGWARSENGNNRLPFFFKSNGTETFAHDFVAGDIVVHTTDSTNGVGQGLANYCWTSPDSGFVSITGGVWIGRDIGRSDHWALAKNGTVLTQGDISSGDAYSRANPFLFSAGSGGAAVLSNIPIGIGDQITLTFDAQGGSGDFVGTNLTLNTVVPEPGCLGVLTVGGLGMGLLRRRRGA